MSKKHYVVLMASLIGAFSFQADLQGRVRGASDIVHNYISVSDYYANAMDDFNQGLWQKAARKFSWIATRSSETSFGLDANFFLGVCYYQLSELDLANDAFSRYLSDALNAEYFQEALEYKFRIAERFKDGEKGHLLGFQMLPRWSSCDEIGLKIYDEVMTTCPNVEIAAQALYGKAKLLWQKKDYRSAIDACQMLINRFPKSEFAPECYLMITKIFLDQSEKEFQNPDLLVLADMNVKRFQQQFPLESRLDEACEDLLRLKEIYAKGLRDTAYFYERINQPRAAVIYYQKVILGFPETKAASESRARLSSFCPMALNELEEMQGSDLS